MKQFRIAVVALLLGTTTGLEAYAQNTPAPVVQPGLKRRPKTMMPVVRKRHRRHRHRRMIQTPFGTIPPGTARRVF